MQPFKKPDLNAPRYRPKKQNILNSDLHKKFITKYPQYKSIVDINLMKNIITTFNTSLWKEAIDKRDGIELPEQLGYIFIGTCPRFKGNNPDRLKSINLGYTVQHQNWESDNNLAKIFYTNYKIKYPFRFSELWSFTGLRDFKRSVAKEYRENWKKYIVVDNMQAVSDLYRKQNFKNYMIEKNNNQIITESYDEFAF